MGQPLAIPRDLLTAFRQFQRDFDQVAAGWIEAGEESAESVELARDGLRAYLAAPADPDEYGCSRPDRLCRVFDHWRGLTAGRVAGVAVVPVLSAAAESRVEDLKWKRSNG